MMDLNKVLMESAILDERLGAFLLPSDLQGPEKGRCSAILCAVAFEHAECLKMLLAGGNFTSAIGLLRLQYEAFVRAMWVFHTAPDRFVGKMMSDLTVESAQAANKLPMLSEMLEALEGKVPKVVMDQLREFKEYSWMPLNSFVHGGIHVIERQGKGYPPELLLQLLKISNGVSVMVGMLLVILSDNPMHRGKVLAIQMEFSGCLPEIRK